MCRLCQSFWLLLNWNRQSSFLNTLSYLSYLIHYFITQWWRFTHYTKLVKAPEHKYIFSKYSRNLNILEIFWACYTKNNFPILFPKYKKIIFWRQSKFKISRFKPNLIWNSKFFNEIEENLLKLRNFFCF